MKTANEALKKDIKYKYWEQPKFEPSSSGVKDFYFGVGKNNTRFQRLKAYKGLKTADGIIETLREEVQPIWDKWPYKPKMFDNLFDDNIAKEVYTTFVRYLPPRKISTDMQEAQNAVLVLTLTSPKVFDEYWMYKPSPKIIVINITHLWVATEKIVGSSWSI